MSTSPDGFRPLLASAPVVPSPRRLSEPAPAFPAPGFATPAARRLAVVPTQFHPLVDPQTDEASTSLSREKAHAAGFAAGFAAGAREAARVAEIEADLARQAAARREAARCAEHADLTAALTAAARALAAREAPVLDRAQAQLHAAALELAEAVLGVELSDGPTSARAALARALSGESVGAVTVRMNPRDVALLGAVPEGVRIVADPALAAGDALTEHVDGVLDARIGAAFARARAVLMTESGADGPVLP